MPREKNAAHVEDERVPAAKSDDEFISFLLSLRDHVDDATLEQPDAFKPALLTVVQGLDTLADAVRTEANRRADA